MSNDPTPIQLILSSLHQVQEPLQQQDIVTLEMVRNLAITEDGKATLTVVLPTPAYPFRPQIQQGCEEALAQLPIVTECTISFGAEVIDDRREGGILDKSVRNTIAVASGKGGVGKSTVAANLALALAQQGARVGILDLDVYGPSIPIMLGASGIPRAKDNQIMPLRQHDVKIMSMGFLVEEEAPVIWRGPMMHQAIQQLLSDVAWGELDYLILDLPPGTGDAQMTLCQSISISGSVMVTTPQDVALADVVKQMKVDFLGEIPLESGVRIGGDQGQPVVIGQPDSPAAKALYKLSQVAAGRLVALNSQKPVPFEADPLLKIL